MSQSESFEMEAVPMATNAVTPRAAARLCARQRELADRLSRLNLDVTRANDPLVQDFPDQALQRQNDEVIDRLRAVTEWELDQIDSALAQIASGSYGRCQRCSDAIEPTRLEVVPHASLCGVCARSIGP